MAENDGQERTEQPTPKRLQEAREKGQVPRSRELSTAATLLAGAGAFLIIGEPMMRSLMGLMAGGLTLSREDVFDTAVMATRLAGSLIDGVWLAAPLFLLSIVAALAAAVALGGWSFSSEALSFKPEKLDPVKGLGRVFSWRGVVEMLKGLAKFVVVATVAVLFLQIQGPRFLGLGAEPLMQGLAHTGNLVGWAFLSVSAAMLLVVAVDVPFQLWDHNRQLKMTKQEIKEEFKQTEGSPDVKARQRRIQMQMAQRRMMEEVPKADVVITNPTHYAVALRYDAREMNAPVVVAKGADLLAARIRTIASENDVPILSAPPLARSLYHTTELGDPIPAGLYRAVAQVLAYVYHLRQGPIYNRDGTTPNLDDLPIPEDLRRD
ncbi:MAG: flagellar biosynthesis protein FlhB [Thiohalomonadaceae bacterium]